MKMGKTFSFFIRQRSSWMMHERPATDGTGNQNFRPQTRKKHMQDTKLEKKGHKKREKITI